MILKQLSAPILVIGSNGNIMYFNQSAGQILKEHGCKGVEQPIVEILRLFSGSEQLRMAIEKIIKKEKTSLKKDQVLGLLCGERKVKYQVELKLIVTKQKESEGLLLVLNEVPAGIDKHGDFIEKTRYLQIENKIATILNTSGDHNAICEIILREFGFHTVSIFMLNRKKEVLSISGTATMLPAFVVDMTQAITIDLKINPRTRNLFYTLPAYRKITLTDLAGILQPEQEVDVSGSFMIEFFAQLRQGNTGEILMVPFLDTRKHVMGAILIVQKENRMYEAEDIDHLKLLTDFINLAIDKQFKEGEIHRLAYYDDLTSLTNIKYIREKIAAKIARKKQFALFSIKIRNFSKVVSSRGDSMGDAIIMHIASKIGQVLDRYKRVIFSRTSGVSFLCCVEECTEQKAKEIVNNILFTFRKPFYIGGNIIHLLASIGIFFSRDKADMEQSIQNTNIALEKAKEKAELIYQIKNNYVIYHEKMGQERMELEALRQELRESLANRKRFVVHYQPKCDINGFIRGYEAMVRWEWKGELVFPGVFIDKITEMGLSDHLFSIVLENVCHDLHNFAAEQMEVSINIAPEQFNDPLLIAKINRTFKQYKIDPTKQRIKFEIIESELVNSRNIQIIKDIHSLGLKISVDDFGSGYSNLQTINELAKANLIDEIKIDKSLIDGITEDSTLLAIILEMAQKLNIDVVAEGVETIFQYYVLRGLYNSAIIQGWLFSKSLPIEQIVILKKDAFKHILDRQLQSASE